MIDKEVLEDVKDAIFNPNKTPALQTGFYDLDEILRGAKKSSLVVIGARPAMGKTAFAMCIMLNLLKQKKKCLLFSIEMSQEDALKRLLVQESEINANLLRCPEMLQENHKAKIQNAFDTISEYDLTIDDTVNITLEKIREKIVAEKPEYVFIDYLQLIYTSDKKSRTDSLTEIVTKLKQIAKDNNCMIFVNSQLSRAVENRCSHHPMLSDLRDCGAIEDVADVVILLYRDAYYSMVDNDEDENGLPQNDAKIIVAKNKLGPVSTIRLIFKSPLLKFINPVISDVF